MNEVQIVTIKEMTKEEKNSLDILDGLTFKKDQVDLIIKDFDMYETEEEDGIAIALTNYITNTAFPDCGKFYLNNVNTYTFELY